MLAGDSACLSYIAEKAICVIFGSQLCLHVHVIYTLSVFLLIGIIPQEHVLQARVDLERCLVIISDQCVGQVGV